MKSTPQFLYGFVLVIMIIVIIIGSTSCEKEKMPPKQPVYSFETDSITDIEGNVYKTVRIGEQWWMAENLRVRRYRNNIPLVYYSSLPNTQWINQTKGAFCFLNNNPEIPSGAFYNWHAIHDPNGLAPDGWRIPSDNDWAKLEEYLGLIKDSLNMTGWRGAGVGEKLKIPYNRTLSWEIDQDILNTNESGFSALPGGCLLHDGVWGAPGIFFTGYWWTSTTYNNQQAWFRHLNYSNTGVFRYFSLYNYGFNVRCIKDTK